MNAARWHSILPNEPANLARAAVSCEKSPMDILFYNLSSGYLLVCLLINDKAKVAKADF